MPDSSLSVVVLPFIRTSESVSIGGIRFRSTDDVEGLDADAASAVREISEMLFLQDDFRIRSATYALVPFIDLDFSSPDLGNLPSIQSVVAYLYTSSHPTLPDIFLSFEHASMIIFSPARVSKYLVYPDFHVIPVGSAADASLDERLPGYACLYNFRHHFWVTHGSRVYGAEPQPTLVGSQDLEA